MTDWRLEYELFLFLLDHRGAYALGGAEASRLARVQLFIQPRITLKEKEV